jgi:hypothetical protein
VTKWKKDDAKTRYTITIFIDDFDQEATTDLINAKQIWEFLKKKYKDVRLSVENSYLTQLTNYRIKEGTTILESWSELSKIRRQLKETRPTITTAFNKAELFQRLLAGLPESYSAIRDGMETLMDTSISEKLQMLQDKEDRLKDKIALTGKSKVDGNRRRGRQGGEGSKHVKINYSQRGRTTSRRVEVDSCRHQRQSQSRSPGPIGCYLCGDKHRVLNYLFLPQAQTLVKYSRERSAARSSLREHIKKQRLIKYKPKRKARGHTKNRASDSSTDSESTADEIRGIRLQD